MITGQKLNHRDPKLKAKTTGSPKSILFRSLDFLFQTFAGNMNEGNRLSCADATKPLRNSVHSLTAYALSPEFASLPAKISDEVKYSTGTRSLSIYKLARDYGNQKV
jgi:talin